MEKANGIMSESKKVKTDKKNRNFKNTFEAENFHTALFKVTIMKCMFRRNNYREVFILQTFLRYMFIT